METKVFSTITICSEWLVGYHDDDNIFSTIAVCSEWLVGYHENDKVFSTITLQIWARIHVVLVIGLY
jgi:hypothetical protein